MRAVAAASHVSLATLYKYFATKEELVEELLLARAERLVSRLELASKQGSTLLERILSTLEAGHAAVREDEVLLGLLRHGARGGSIRRTVVAVERAIDRIGVALVEPAVQSGELQVTDPEALVAMARVIVHGWFASEAHRDDAIEMPRITSVLADLVRNSTALTDDRSAMSHEPVAAVADR
jgi:AcrR family transcriptional regulator